MQMLQPPKILAPGFSAIWSVNSGCSKPALIQVNRSTILGVKKFPRALATLLVRQAYYYFGCLFTKRPQVLINLHFGLVVFTVSPVNNNHVITTFVLHL